MPALTYATVDDWSDGDLPDNAERLLARASALVRAATRTAMYRTNTAGLPLDTAVLEPFRDAVLVQAQAWARAGVDPDRPLESGARVAASKSLGSRSVTYADAGAIVQSRQAAVDGLSVEAWQILADAGLTGGRPWVIG